MPSGCCGSRCRSTTRSAGGCSGAREAVFAVVYALGALLASFAPDVWNTEKPMDMAFINAHQRVRARSRRTTRG